jgi:hypothetical protein
MVVEGVLNGQPEHSGSVGGGAAGVVFGVQCFRSSEFARRLARGAAALQAVASSQGRTPGFARGPRLARAPDGPAKKLAPFRGSDTFCLPVGCADRLPSDTRARRCGPVGAQRPEGQRRRETGCALEGVRAPPIGGGLSWVACHPCLARPRATTGRANRRVPNEPPQSATLSTSFPKFAPSKSLSSVSGKWSMPSTTSSRETKRPSFIHCAMSRTASG